MSHPSAHERGIVKRIMLVMVAVVVAIFMAQPANATTYATFAIHVLKKTPVYVAVGTESTDSTTAGQLKDQLNKGDNINLVMLPSKAATTETQALSIAKAISKGVGKDKIIGLSVGDGSTFVAYAPSLPSGTPAELMQHAVTVSTTSSETLITFVRNVHDWQTENPQAATPAHKAKSAPVGLILLIVLGCALLATGLVFTLYYIWRYLRRRIKDEVKYNSPHDVNQLIKQLMNKRNRITDDRMNNAVLSVCLYTEKYFSVFGPGKRNNSTELQSIERNLASAVKIVDKFIEVSKDKDEFYDDRRAILALLNEANESFAASLLKSIRSGNKQAMIEYEFDTNVLNGSLYR